MKSAYDIIIRPVITEQSMDGTADKKYVFMVALDANKVEIKKAVEEIFGKDIKVAKVNTPAHGRQEKAPGRLSGGLPRSLQEGCCYAGRKFQDHRILRRHGLISSKGETQNGNQNI